MSNIYRIHSSNICYLRVLLCHVIYVYKQVSGTSNPQPVQGVFSLIFSWCFLFHTFLSFYWYQQEFEGGVCYGDDSDGLTNTSNTKHPVCEIKFAKLTTIGLQVKQFRSSLYITTGTLVPKASVMFSLILFLPFTILGCLPNDHEVSNNHLTTAI